MKRLPIIATAVLMAWAGGARAADNSAAGPNWGTTIEHWPDLQGGTWIAPNADGAPHGEDLSLTPAARKEMQAAMKQFAAGQLAGPCDPRGLPRHLGNEFFYTKGMILILGTPDYYMVVRKVYMDGRPHNDDDAPSFFGQSIGHWEGKTLVIDTNNIEADEDLTDGLKSQGQTHLVERYTLTGPGVMQLDLTVENPAVLAKPYHTVRTYHLERGVDFPEAYCTNNRNLTGETDLTPPP